MIGQLKVKCQNWGFWPNLIKTERKGNFSKANGHFLEFFKNRLCDEFLILQGFKTVLGVFYHNSNQSNLVLPSWVMGGDDCTSYLKNELQQCQFWFLWPRNLLTIFLYHFYRHLCKKTFLIFLSKILSCTSSWCNQPPPITWAPFLIPSLIRLRNEVLVKWCKTR